MRELEQEDPLTATTYANIIRSHIISSYQHLKVSLFTIEKLMALYNDQKGKKSDSA
jgi:hypothetical protein